MSYIVQVYGIAPGDTDASWHVYSKHTVKEDALASCDRARDQYSEDQIKYIEE